MSSSRPALLRAGIATLLLAAALAGDTRAQGLPEKFDPSRDGARDLAAAQVQAATQGKRVIADVGGEWCVWCHIMDRFLAADPELMRLRDRNYVWVKINYSEENRNRALLSRFPPVAGYPHLFVLDANGVLLHSQDTSELEEGRSYSRERFRAFLLRWARAASA